MIRKSNNAGVKYLLRVTYEDIKTMLMDVVLMPLLLTLNRYLIRFSTVNHAQSYESATKNLYNIETNCERKFVIISFRYLHSNSCPLDV